MKKLLPTVLLIMWNSCFAQSLTQLEKECYLKNADACFNLAVKYEQGQYISKDTFKAVEFYQKSCEGGNAGGCNNLAWAYSEGVGVRLDKSKALLFYGKACDLKNQTACDNYASLKNIGIK